MSIGELIQLIEKIIKALIEMFSGFENGDAESGEDTEATV